MLEIIREKMKGVFATVIVGLFCAIFAMWGVESLFERSGQAQGVVSVNGEPITDPEIAQATQIIRQRYMQMLGGKVDPKFLNDQMLREPAIDSIISRRLLEEQTSKMKMTVGPVTLDKEIVRDPTFREEGKGFDAEYFKEKLRSFGMTPAMYRQQLAEQVVLGQLQHGISGSAFVTNKQVNDIANIEAQTRSFEYLQLPLKTAMEGVVPTDEALEQYYKEHSADFMTEEKVSIEYLDLNKSSLAQNIPLEESEVRASYDQEAANFKPSVERRAAHILIETKPDGSEKTVIEKISTRLKAGDSFAVLAKQFSSDKESAVQGGDVGFTTGQTFVPEFEQALASLANPGDVSQPVKTEFGYHFIKLLEKKDTVFPPFEERKADIEKQLRQAKAGPLYAEKLDQMTESTYSAGDLAGPASELSMEVQKTPVFTRRGGVGIAGQQKIIDMAFSSDLIDSGKNSQIIELSVDRAIVLRVASHEIPKQRELAEVKAEIVGKIKTEQAAILLKNKADSLRKRIQSGTSIAAIASEEKISPVAVKSGKRTTKDGDPELLSSVFKMSKPSEGVIVTDAVQLANGDWAVLHLVAVEDMQVQPDATEFKAVQQKLEAAVGAADFSLYEQGLRKAADIVRKQASSSGEGEG